MNGELGKLGEILLLVYGIGVSIYMGWWGYILIARPDLVERWRETQPRWVQKLMLIKKLPGFVDVLLGVTLLFFSMIFLLIFCSLFIRNLLQIGR